MKRFRVIFLGLVVLAMLAATGCFTGDPSTQLLGTWVSNTSFAEPTSEATSPVAVTLSEGVGYNGFIFFAYSYNASVTWNGHTWNIAASAEAARKASPNVRRTRAEFDPSTDAFCVWGAFLTMDANALAIYVPADTDNDGTYDGVAFELVGTLADNKLNVVYMSVDGNVVVDSADDTMPAEEIFQKAL